jgi:hypothetical protein
LELVFDIFHKYHMTIPAECIAAEVGRRTLSNRQLDDNGVRVNITEISYGEGKSQKL